MAPDSAQGRFEKFLITDYNKSAGFTYAFVKK